MASFSSSSTHAYQVFLSFRGIDTRTNFTAHLHHALCQGGITTFLDDNDLRIGDEISSTLLKSIEESKISIIVFSKNYAFSKWCLEELLKILECKANGQEVLSLFYKVDPADVRHQRESFNNGLAKLSKRFNKTVVDKWKSALTEAAGFSGIHFEDSSNRTEPDLIKEVIDWVNFRLRKKTCLQVSGHQVGIDSHVEKLASLLNIEKNESTFGVGIFGIGGIGKTTIAKAIYNFMIASNYFEGCCFLENIRETSSNGMGNLQNKLIFMILGDSSLKVDNIDQGITLIKQRLYRKKIFLVLDDVDHPDQLEYLAGNINWFGLGSRIIITTRNKHLLDTNELVVQTYQVNELDDDKALQLFSLHAFNRDRPDTKLEEVTKDALSYCAGLPLALKVIGLALKEQKKDYWESKLDSYKKSLDNDIHKQLRISYDGLNPNAKKIFLHIACFFKGENVEYVEKLLDSCGFHLCGIDELKNECLITESRGSLVMHDLLQEMGKEIVRLESPDKPHKRSRLWFHEDVRCVLEGNMGKNEVNGILIDLPKADLVHLSSRAFMEMNMLKLFISHNARFSEELDVLPHNLRVLYWREYPGESFQLQSNVRGDNLVVLGMPYSHLEGLNGVEIFQKLTIMNFTNCQFLKEVPDILRISNLATLILDGCVRLEEVHCYVGFLKKLVYLSLENCFSLRSFPRSLKLISLESLILYGCSKIKNFPEIGCRMERLKKIDFQYTGIKELPSSIEHLVGVRELYLAGCKRLGGLPDNIEHLKNLECLNLIGCTQIKRLSEFIGWLFVVKKLDLSGCTNLMSLPNSIYKLKYLEQLNLQDCSQMVMFPANGQMRQSMPSNDGYSSLSFPKLQQLDLRNCSLSRSNFFEKFDCGSSMNHLDLSGSDIDILPPCIKRFVGLKWLLLNECKQLQKISELPQNIKAVYARGCTSLKRFQFNIYPALGWIDLSNCHELRENMGNDMQTHLMSEGRVEDHKFSCVFPGNKISDWFDRRQELVNSNSCKIDINKLAHLDWKITRIAFSAVIGTKSDIPDVQDGIYSDGQDEDNENFEIIFEVIRDGEKIYSFVEENISHRFHSDHVWLHYSVLDSFKLKGDNLQVKFKLRSALLFFKSCGFHMEYRYEEKVEDVMDGDQLSKRRRGGDDDNGYLESTWYPQKRHCSTLGT